MNKARKDQLRRFTELLNLPPFHNWHLLDQALTHSSYTNEDRTHHSIHNERLEFLGDAVLDMVVGEYLFRRYPDMPEGNLTKARASVVSEEPLACVCASFQMGSFLLLGKGEALTGGRTRNSIMADAFEAVVGAVYIDCSYTAARDFILKQLDKYLQLVDKGIYGKDYKTYFQELLQRDGAQDIRYRLCREEGPDHNKTFFMEVTVNGEIMGTGSGKTKKSAEQHAAYKALEKMNALSF